MRIRFIFSLLGSCIFLPYETYAASQDGTIQLSSSISGVGGSAAPTSAGTSTSSPIDTTSMSQAKRYIFEDQLYILRDNATYQSYLTRWQDTKSTVFVSYAWRDDTNKDWVKAFCKDLVLAGIPAASVIYDYWHSLSSNSSTISALVNKVSDATKVVVVGSKSTTDKTGKVIPGLRDKYQSRDIHAPGVVTQELELLALRRAAQDAKGIIPVYYDGENKETLPDMLCTVDALDLKDDDRFIKFFDLIQKLLSEYIVKVDENPISETRNRIHDWFKMSEKVILGFEAEAKLDIEKRRQAEETSLAESFRRGLQRRGLSGGYASASSSGAAGDSSLTTNGAEGNLASTGAKKK